MKTSITSKELLQQIIGSTKVERVEGRWTNSGHYILQISIDETSTSAQFTANPLAGEVEIGEMLNFYYKYQRLIEGTVNYVHYGEKLE